MTIPNLGSVDCGTYQSFWWIGTIFRHFFEEASAVTWGGNKKFHLGNFFSVRIPGFLHPPMWLAAFTTSLSTTLGKQLIQFWCFGSMILTNPWFLGICCFQVEDGGDLGWFLTIFDPIDWYQKWCEDVVFLDMNRRNWTWKTMDMNQHNMLAKIDPRRIWFCFLDAFSASWVARQAFFDLWTEQLSILRTHKFQFPIWPLRFLRLCGIGLLVDIWIFDIIP